MKKFYIFRRLRSFLNCIKNNISVIILFMILVYLINISKELQRINSKITSPERGFLNTLTQRATNDYLSKIEDSLDSIDNKINDMDTKLGKIQDYTDLLGDIQTDVRKIKSNTDYLQWLR